MILRNHVQTKAVSGGDISLPCVEAALPAAFLVAITKERSQVAVRWSAVQSAEHREKVGKKRLDEKRGSFEGGQRTLKRFER